MGHQEQLYIEPNGVVAVPGNGVPDDADGITVYGSMQCPYYVHRALMVLLALPGDKVRVVQTETGGGFGGKEEYPSMIAGHAALLARKAGRPVKLIYDRVEDMVATTKRHPAIVRHKTGVTRDGRLTAIEIDAVFDAARSDVSQSSSGAASFREQAMRCDHRIRNDDDDERRPTARSRLCARASCRGGYGSHQRGASIRCACGRSTLRPGDTTATGQRLGKDWRAAGAARSGEADRLQRRRRAIASASRLALRDKTPVKHARGWGSRFFPWVGFTGGGSSWRRRRRWRSPAAARILVASTEIGQGTRTMHAQIVADTLGLPYDCIDVNAADTAVVPDSRPTVASRTCIVVGRILQRCAEEMKQRLGRLTPREYLRTHGPGDHQSATAG
jgi:CO/xanthine dehydrogenase Mo-binding subunit